MGINLLTMKEEIFFNRISENLEVAQNALDEAKRELKQVIDNRKKLRTEHYFATLEMRLEKAGEEINE